MRDHFYKGLFMNHLLRILFNTLTALSLLLLLMAIALWVRSHYVADVYYHSQTVFLISNDGVLSFVCEGLPALNSGVPLGYWTQNPFPTSLIPRVPNQPGVRHIGNLPGLSWLITSGGQGYKSIDASGTPVSILFTVAQEFKLHYALLSTLFFILPFLSFLRIHRRRRHLPNHCAKCNYDLRATPNRCPECGTAVV